MEKQNKRGTREERIQNKNTITQACQEYRSKTNNAKIGNPGQKSQHRSSHGTSEWRGKPNKFCLAVCQLGRDQWIRCRSYLSVLLWLYTCCCGGGQLHTCYVRDRSPQALLRAPSLSFARVTPTNFAFFNLLACLLACLFPPAHPPFSRVLQPL